MVTVIDVSVGLSGARTVALGETIATVGPPVVYVAAKVELPPAPGSTEGGEWSSVKNCASGPVEARNIRNETSSVCAEDRKIVVRGALAGGKCHLDLVRAGGTSRRAGRERPHGKLRGRLDLDLIGARRQTAEAIGTIGAGLHRSHPGDIAQVALAVHALQVDGQPGEARVAGNHRAQVLGVEIRVTGEAGGNGQQPP